MKKKTTLVLFDIDSTILHSGGAGVTALRLALKNRFGRDDDLDKVEIAGRTDSWIARQIFALHGIEPSVQHLAHFFDGYLEQLKHQLPQTQGHLLPGVLALLETLSARPHVALGLLTGNLRGGAQLKLEHYGVSHFFAFGAFADDHHDRNELGPVARMRANEWHGCEFATDRIFVIGDTPHDIACGKAIGAKTVGVATGNYTRAELVTHEPDFLLDDLSDVQRIIAMLQL